MMKNRWSLAIGLALLVVISIQFALIGGLRNDMAELRAELAEPPPVQQEDASPARPVFRRIAAAPADAGLSGRVAQLEAAVAEFSAAVEHLRERGRLPITEASLQAYRARFSDPAASDRDRLRALNMLRRNRQFSDDLQYEALGWLQTATNAETREELAEALDGATNAALKQPLIALLGSETSRRVREEIVDTLEAFSEDPAVEETLWNLAQNDPDPRVRSEAMESLASGGLSETRAAALRQQALNPEASLENRLIAFDALRRADETAPEIVAGLAQLANNQEDPIARARVFRALDGVEDPSVKAPLVHGLQDPNPVVREEAADALARFAGDPKIQEWLSYVIQNDSDPRVQREAHQALERARREDGDRGRRDGGRGRWR